MEKSATEETDTTKKKSTTEIPLRFLHSIPESRELLGGIGHTKFYDLVKEGKIKLTRLGGRSFATPDELRRCVEEAS